MFARRIRRADQSAAIGRCRTPPRDGITMINFGMGSANAATIMDLLSAI